MVNDTSWQNTAITMEASVMIIQVVCCYTGGCNGVLLLCVSIVWPVPMELFMSMKPGCSRSPT